MLQFYSVLRKDKKTLKYFKNIINKMYEICILNLLPTLILLIAELILFSYSVK